MSTLLEEITRALSERYRVERELGRGGMATVYLADDLKHGRRVAIKVMSPDVSSSVGGERFQREIQIAARLSHPHILPVHDSGEAGGLLYYVMPFVEGESLRARIDRESQLPIEDAIQITCEVCDALQYAHDQGVVHRDIKPENVLLHGGHAVVMDFGIARLVNDSGADKKLTATGLSLGTAAYMSPEQFVGEHVDGRADLYSVACMLYEMLVGQTPFTGPNAMAIIARATMELPPAIRVVRGTVPEEIEDAVLHALEKVPADRFATLAQFKQALLGMSGATRSMKATTRHPAMRYTSRYTAAPAPSTAARLRNAAVIGGVLLVVGLGGLLGWKVGYGRSRAPNLLAAADATPIAVTYFATDESQGKIRSIADGLTESLIGRLSQVPTLDIVSRNGVAPFRGRDLSPDSVAHAVKAKTIVVGDVKPIDGGKRVRLTVSFYSPDDKATYDVASLESDTGQIVQLQGEMADRIADKLRERIGTAVALREERSSTRNNQAWLYLQRARTERKAADSLAAAGSAAAALGAYASVDSLLALAQREDAKWVDPLVLRADVAYRRAVGARPDQSRVAAAIDSGLAHVTAAIALDPADPDAYEIEGKLLFLRFSEIDAKDPRAGPRTLADADTALRRSVSLNRAQAGAWAALSQVDYRKHPPQVADALTHAKNAYDSDRYLESANAILKRLFWSTHDLEQFTDAQHWCDEGRSRFPKDPFFTQCALWLLTTDGLATANPDTAWTIERSYLALVPPAQRDFEKRDADILVAGAFARASQKLGDRTFADSARHLLVRARPPRSLDPRLELTGNEAIVRAMLGDKNEAVSLLAEYLTANPDHRQGFAERVSPWWRSLRDDPKFQALLDGAR